MEDSKAVRALIKTKLNLKPKDVSVRGSHAGYSVAVRVNIKSLLGLKKLAEIKDICRDFTKYDVCEVSGEILQGGNTYVNADVDYNFSRSIKDKLSAKFDVLSADLDMTEAVVTMFDDIEISFSDNLDRYIFVMKDSNDYISDYHLNNVGDNLFNLMSMTKRFDLLDNLED